MVLTAASCSPRRPGSFATVACGIASADLTPASGCQDHTTLPSAVTPLVLRRQGVHRIPHPTFRDDRDTPLLVRAGRGESAADLGVTATPSGCDKLTRRAICAEHTCASCPSGQITLLALSGGFY